MTRQEADQTTRTGVPLTPREQAVLAELTEAVTVEEIAARLWVSRNTVKSQLRSVYRKLGVSTRAEAVAWARDAGLQLTRGGPREGSSTAGPSAGRPPAQRSPSQPSG